MTVDAILTFHSLDDSGSVLSFPPARFERLLDRLIEEGVRFVAPADLLAPGEGGVHRVALTFDDGMRSVMTEGLPRLAERGITSTMYVVTEFVGRDNRWPTQPPGAPVFELLDWGGLREWVAAGQGVGSHTATHARLDLPRDPDAWTAELPDARACLEDRLGTDAASFAYPYGRFSGEAVDRVRGCHRDATTTRMRYVRRADDAHLLPRIDTYYLRSVDVPLFGPSGRGYVGLRALLRALRGQ